MSNPMRRSEGHIGKNILKLTPIGTSMEEVLEYAEKKGWEIWYVSYEFGFLKQYGYWTLEEHSDNVNIGEKSIGVVASRYKTYFFIDTVVKIFWGFDENSKLIEISVSKEFNVP